ncbi:MAG: HlyD family efflux transporter periplasmic adaptor subunit [candidate division Zixibacteria bacterium]|nr:HlyD family efflux transporter periplasmic adaptor subunit [candidate division Zixibacteria bacterium]
MDRKIEKKKWTPKRIVWSAGGLALVVLIVYVLLSSTSGSTLRIDSNRLTISEVTRGEFQEYITQTGTVSPIRTHYLDATQGGSVIKVFAENGSLVEIGDSLLQLDNTDLHLDIMYREAQLYEQINNLRNTRLAMEENSLALRGNLLEIDHQISNSKRIYEQYQQLLEKNLSSHISQNDYDKAKEDYDYWMKRRELTLETQRQDSILRTVQIEQLEASVTRMQANLEVVKQKLENLIVRAPIGGQLTSLNAEIGELKSRGERLGQIDVLDGYKIRAAVDEYYISRIAVGQSATAEINGVSYNLTVKKVYTEVRDGRFQIDLEFDAAEPEGIRRGQSIQVRLMLGDLAQAVLLPRGGFYQKTGGNWIYVLDESSQYAVKRNISIGRYNPHFYEVLEGLEPGERCITSPYDNFEDFDRIIFSDR